MIRTLKFFAVFFCLVAFAQDKTNNEEAPRPWRRTTVPDRQSGLQVRNQPPEGGWRRQGEETPPAHEPEDMDPPDAPQGEPGGCSNGDMFVSERGTLKAVDRNKWKDFIQNTSYVHVEAHNTKEEDVFITDGRPGALAKGVCSGATVWFSFRRTKWSQKDRAYVALIATSMRDRSKRYRSLMIPLWREDTRTYEWPIDEFRVASSYSNQNLSDTYPSVLEFQPDARDERFNEERDRKIDCRLYPWECYYGGGYGVGRRGYFGSGWSVRNPYVDPRFRAAQDRFLPPLGSPRARYSVGRYYVGGGYTRGGGVVHGGNNRFFGGPDPNGPVPHFGGAVSSNPPAKAGGARPSIRFVSGGSK